jgi:hypothetical protein
MRYAAAEKLEIIRLVEQSSLSVKRTLAQLGIPRLHLLRLVRAPSGARRRGLGRWPAGAAPPLEQNPGAGG